jgi:transcription-repair coupling factor (superfamily II helicase)
LTETPVTEHLLAAVHGRLSRQRVEGEDEEMAAEMAAAGGVSVFPGWEFFSAVAGAEKSLLTLVPKCTLFVEEPAMVRNQMERWWNKVEQRHERSAMGSLITPEDLYVRPELLQAMLENHVGLDLDQLGVVDVLDVDSTLGEIELNTRPTARFHGSIPALTEQLKALMEAGTRTVLAAPNQGDVERLATVLREYQIPYRLGSRPARPSGETVLDEGNSLSGDFSAPVIVRTPLSAGVSFGDPTMRMWQRGRSPSGRRRRPLFPIFAT